MQLITAFLSLVRWKNLLFIALTQALFYFVVLPSTAINENAALFLIENRSLFFILMFASILIAAAGYIINDYFDQEIDAINKPKKNVVNKLIKRRWAILWHLIFSAAGIVFSIYVSLKTHILIISIINFLCVFILWFYSTVFKRKLLSGNIIISFLTAWVILSVYVFSGNDLFHFEGWNYSKDLFDSRKLFKIAIVYSGFAFVLTLIREVIKDAEDMYGDMVYNCNTMPIAWGVPATKVFAGVWFVVLIALVAISTFYAFHSGWKMGSVYSLLFILTPLLMALSRLRSAIKPEDYNSISNMIKIIMLAGILSMFFFYKP